MRARRNAGSTRHSLVNRCAALLMAGVLCWLVGCGKHMAVVEGSLAHEAGSSAVETIINCPEDYWIYDGSLFEQDAQPGEEDYQPYLLIRKCTEVWGYEYDWLTDRQRQVFDLLYGEYLSGDIRPDGRQSRCFTLPFPMHKTELRNVIQLYEMATDCYGYRAFRYTLGDNESEKVACKGVLCPHKLPNMEYHLLVTALEYEDESLNTAYDETIQMADEILSGMEPGQSEAEICFYIVRYLCKHVAYVSYHDTDDTDGYINFVEEVNGIPVSNYREDIPYVTAYGALKNGLANCNGYCSAFDLLAKRAGLSSIMVSGFREDDPELRDGHSWNMVQVNGKWYQMDVTLADMGESGKINMRWFLFAGSGVSHDRYTVRKYARTILELPECEAEPCPFSYGSYSRE